VPLKAFEKFARIAGRTRSPPGLTRSPPGLNTLVGRRNARVERSPILFVTVRIDSGRAWECVLMSISGLWPRMSAAAPTSPRSAALVTMWVAAV